MAEKAEMFESILKHVRDRPDPKAEDNPQSFSFAIEKRNDEQQIVFGWASVAADLDGTPILDRQGDIIDIDELEPAVYDYVLKSRSSGEMHESNRRGIGVMIESIVFTKEKMKALGIPSGLLPYGWWIGFKITDADAWAKIRDGEYKMFSIEGKGKRIPIQEEGDGNAE